MGKIKLRSPQKMLLLELPRRLGGEHSVGFGSMVQNPGEDSHPPFILNISCIFYIIPNPHL